MDKTVLVPVADGTEELEAVAIIDVLRRAGATVTVASVTGAQQITASRGVVIVADALIEACINMDEQFTRNCMEFYLCSSILIGKLINQGALYRGRHLRKIV